MLLPNQDNAVLTQLHDPQMIDNILKQAHTFEKKFSPIPNGNKVILIPYQKDYRIFC